MPRLEPTPRTVKQLFAQSGNLCAFPGCTEELVDADNDVIGQICHIVAAEPGGERYSDDPTMDDEAKRSFGNLILLCPKHHIKTDDTSKYPVSTMREMKRKHQEKYGAQPINVEDLTIEKAIKGLRASNVIVNTGTGVVNQVITYGMSFSEVRTLVLELLEANNPRVAKEATDTAILRVAKFAQFLSDEIGNESLSETERQEFADPDVQFALSSAITASARSSEETLHRLLSVLLARRIKGCTSSFLRVVLNEAILVASKLTSDHVRILALKLVLNILHNFNIDNWEDFKIQVAPLIAPVVVEWRASECEYLIYTGCFTNAREETYDQFLKVFVATFPKLFPFTGDELSRLGFEDARRETIFREAEDGLYQFSREGFAEDNADVEPRFTAWIFSFPKLAHEKVVEGITRELDFGGKLLSVIDRKVFMRTELTPVGAAIAASYLKQETGFIVNLQY